MIKRKIKNYHTVEINSKSEIKIDNRSHSWLATCTLIKSSGVKLALWGITYPLSEMMQTCKCFPRVSKMPTFTYYEMNSVIIKNATILNIMI